MAEPLAILVLPFLQDFDAANARVGAERNPLKTEVACHVNDLNAVPPEWKTDEVRSMAKISAVTSGSITLGVAVGSQQFITDQLLSKADVIRAMHERVQLCQDPQTEFAFSGRVWGSVVFTTSCEFMVTKSWRNKVQRRLTMELGNGPSNDMAQATLSASQSGIGSAPAHLGALLAAKPRTHGMIRDAVLAGLLREQLLETRLSEVIETATSTYLSALDNDEQETARLFIQRAAQAGQR